MLFSLFLSFSIPCHCSSLFYFFFFVISLASKVPILYLYFHMTIGDARNEQTQIVNLTSFIIAALRCGSKMMIYGIRYTVYGNKELSNENWNVCPISIATIWWWRYLAPQKGPKTENFITTGIVLTENVLTYTLHVYFCYQKLNEQQIANIWNQISTHFISDILFSAKLTNQTFAFHYFYSLHQIESSQMMFNVECSINTMIGSFSLKYSLCAAYEWWLLLFIVALEAHIVPFQSNESQMIILTHVLSEF